MCSYDRRAGAQPSCNLLFVPGHAQYDAIAVALLPLRLIAKLTTKRMESCLCTMARLAGTRTLGTVSTGLLRRCSVLASLRDSLNPSG
jgi:hypothetical protein